MRAPAEPQSHLHAAGQVTADAVAWCGAVALVLARAGRALARASPGELLRTLARFGWGSLGLAMMVAAGTGAVIVLETATYTVAFGARDILGGMAGISIVREFGPLMVALVMAGWVGASNAAETANLRLGGQVASLQGMGVDPFEVIFAPRIAGMILSMMTVMLAADVAAILGGACSAQLMLGIPGTAFLRSFGQWLHLRDVGEGLVKTGCFSLAIALISTRSGLRTQGGAKAVGRSVAGSVVQGVVAVLILDCLVTVAIGGAL